MFQSDSLRNDACTPQGVSQGLQEVRKEHSGAPASVYGIHLKFPRLEICVHFISCIEKHTLLLINNTVELPKQKLFTNGVHSQPIWRPLL